MCRNSVPLSDPPTVSLGEQQSAISAPVARAGGGTAVGRSKDSAGGPA
jgi:hypothetical protein